MLVQLHKPKQEVITAWLHQRRNMALTYKEVGYTAELPSNQSVSGYVIDHNRIRLGQGYDCYRRAKESFSTWQMFNLGWARICWAEASYDPMNMATTAPIQENSVVGVLAYVGVWSLNPCRIIYTLDDTVQTNRAGQDVRQFGFGYGTLPGHLVKGEERFLLEWNQSDDSVWYDILAFSQPNQWLTRFGYPVVRQFQKRFARDSKRAMIEVFEKEREIR